jgi:hypothetical protein
MQSETNKNKAMRKSFRKQARDDTPAFSIGSDDSLRY